MFKFSSWQACWLNFQIPVKGKNRADRNQEEIEERVISIISSLFGERNSHFYLLFCLYCTVLLFEHFLLGSTRIISGVRSRDNYSIKFHALLHLNLHF